MNDHVRLRIAEVAHLQSDFVQGAPPKIVFLRDDDIHDPEYTRVNEIGSIGVPPNVVPDHSTTQLIFDHILGGGPIPHAHAHTRQYGWPITTSPSLMAADALDAASNPASAAALGLILLSDDRGRGLA